MNKKESKSLKAKHILVQQEFEAKDLQRKLAEGKSFEDLARDFSLCGSAEDGGDLGEFPRGAMVASFEQALLKLKPGEISDVVKTQFGYHLIKRL
ncbi:MAG: peptidylprolyl isomerase [Bacteriovoracaceae bacterium]|nr:peptidylprolyl isomerase [Bacteriovoracaceae bacterium]